MDYIGSLAELKRAYPDVQILADAKESPYINGEKESLKMKKLQEKYTMEAVWQMYSAY